MMKLDAQLMRGILQKQFLNWPLELFQEILSSNIYHFAGDKQCTWYDFAKIILKESYAQKKIKTLPEVIPVTSEEFHNNFLYQTKIFCSRFNKTLL